MQVNNRPIVRKGDKSAKRLYDIWYRAQNKERIKARMEETRLTEAYKAMKRALWRSEKAKKTRLDTARRKRESESPAETQARKRVTNERMRVAVHARRDDGVLTWGEIRLAKASLASKIGCNSSAILKRLQKWRPSGFVLCAWLEMLSGPVRGLLFFRFSSSRQPHRRIR